VPTLVLGSDLQCGKPYRPVVAEAFREAALALDPDVVVIAGDLTQRAKAREFREVRRFLGGFGKVPVVVTPGNHDVPLYRFWERLLIPYRNWRRFIDPSLDSITRVPGVSVVALNSSAPRRAIIGGRIDRTQVEFARRALESAAPDDVRVLVIHHHFVPTEDGEGGRPLPNARSLLEGFATMGVDLILGGHVHQTHITSSGALGPGEAESFGIALIRCGTTASSRGRGPEADRNSFAVVRVSSEVVEVVPYFFDRDGGRFEPSRAQALERGASAAARETP
jgi:3',5'-cyclic AMP phosphodiesterase CpdA